MVFIFVLYAVAVFRAYFCTKVDLMIVIFTLAYFIQNFVVNTIDFIAYNKFIGYYDDKEFQQMVSYKIFQITQCLIVAFVYS